MSEGKILAIVFAVAAVTWPLTYWTWDHDMTALYYICSGLAGSSTACSLCIAVQMVYFWRQDRKA